VKKSVESLHRRLSPKVGKKQPTQALPGLALSAHNQLVMVLVLTVTRIPGRILIKRLLAAGRAEIVCLTIIFRLTSGGCRLDIHSTNRISDCIFHAYSFLINACAVARGQQWACTLKAGQQARSCP
jgi:hypothetical protein